MPDVISRDELAEHYLDQLPYPPYPVQEEALLAWFTAEQGVLVCAPTGTGKTLIAQAALFEALHTGTRRLLHHAAHRPDRAEVPRDAGRRRALGLLAPTTSAWSPATAASIPTPASWSSSPRSCSIACCTPRRSTSPTSPPSSWTSSTTSPTRERGIVWELSLALLPPHVRLLLLSATVGNAARVPQLAGALPRPQARAGRGQGPQGAADLSLGARRVPQRAARRDGQGRRRDAARRRRWSSASTATSAGASPSSSRAAAAGRAGSRRRCTPRSTSSTGRRASGPKLKQMLHRGVGVHHAGLLPKYRRVVEDLFQRKLLAVVHLHRDAGRGHQPAGPLGGADVAGEGAVRQAEADRRQHGPADLRPRRPAAVRRPGLRLRPGPRGRREDPALEGEVRRDPRGHEGPRPAEGQEGAEEEEADAARDRDRTGTRSSSSKLKAAPPGKLYSKGPLPWRLLAYLLKISPEVAAGPHRDPQAADGRAAHQGRREGPRQHAADAGRPAAS